MNAIQQALILLALVFLFVDADLPVTCPQCDPNWTPFPNMVSGLRGYNLVTGDPLHDLNDPGFVSQIFLPTFMTDNDMVSLDPAITASELSNCDRSMESHSYTSISDLRLERCYLFKNFYSFIFALISFFFFG